MSDHAYHVQANRLKVSKYPELMREVLDSDGIVVITDLIFEIIPKPRQPIMGDNFEIHDVPIWNHHGRECKMEHRKTFNIDTVMGNVPVIQDPGLDFLFRVPLNRAAEKIADQENQINRLGHGIDVANANAELHKANHQELSDQVDELVKMNPFKIFFLRLFKRDLFARPTK